MRLLLIRHGQTSSNVKQLLDTAVPGPGLTNLGIRQAAAVPEALAEEKIGAIFASSQTRAQQTGAPLAEAFGLQVEVRDGVREITAGDLEMAGDEASVVHYISTIIAWIDDDRELRVPGGESGVEFLARYDEVIAEALATGADTVAVVSHGAAIRTWAGVRAGNITKDFVAEHALSNTGIVTMDGDFDSGWQVLNWADAAIGGPSVDDQADDGPTGDPIS